MVRYHTQCSFNTLCHRIKNLLHVSARDTFQEEGICSLQTQNLLMRIVKKKNPLSLSIISAYYP